MFSGILDNIKAIVHTKWSLWRSDRSSHVLLSYYTRDFIWHSLTVHIQEMGIPSSCPHSVCLWSGRCKRVSIYMCWCVCVCVFPSASTVWSLLWGEGSNCLSREGVRLWRSKRRSSGRSDKLGTMEVVVVVLVTLCCWRSSWLMVVRDTNDLLWINLPPSRSALSFCNYYNMFDFLNSLLFYFLFLLLIFKQYFHYDVNVFCLII